MDVVKEAQWVFDTEIAALQATKDSLSGDFETIVDLILKCTGKVIVTGMGKSGHIGGGNPKFCVTAKSGANREKFIMGGRRVKRLPPC